MTERVLSQVPTAEMGFLQSSCRNADKNFVREGPVNYIISHWRCLDFDCSFRLFSNRL